MIALDGSQTPQESQGGYLPPWLSPFAAYAAVRPQGVSGGGSGDESSKTIGIVSELPSPVSR